MIAIARQAVPRGTPCAECGKPIRTGAHPKGWFRKYCDRLRCRRARVNRVSRAAYRALGADGAQRQRELYDPEKRRGRYKTLSPQKRAMWRVAGRRYYRVHRADLLAKKRATYDPAARHQRYLDTGT